MRRRAFLALAAAPLAAQDVEHPARRAVLDVSRALDAGNAALALARFDRRRFPGYRELETEIVALLERWRVGSSVDIPPFDGSGEEVELTVDWLLQLTPRNGVGPLERRRKDVRVRVSMTGKPKIIALEPVELFRSTPADA